VADVRTIAVEGSLCTHIRGCLLNVGI
jgi:hypothetical protein